MAELLTLDEAASELGVHYMTAYRYVRTGRLPANRVGGQWRVDRRDLKLLQPGAETPPGPKARSGSAATSETRVRRFSHRLIAGDEAGAWKLVEAARAAGVEPDQIYVELLAPAMELIGQRWADGELSIADEHRATAVAGRLVGRMGPSFVRRGRSKGTVIVAAPAPDQHGLPCALLADLLRGSGYSVIDLGANTPAVALVDACRLADRLKVVALGATTANDRKLKSFIADVRAEVPGTPILLGGSAIVDEDHAQRLGADAYTGRGAADAIETISHHATA